MSESLGTVHTAHPVLGAVAAIDAALKGVADVEPVFMSVGDKRAALVALTGLVDRVEELRGRVLTASEDVADAEGARDPAAWLAQHARIDAAEARRALRLARSLDERWVETGRAVREGRVGCAQAQVIVRALDDLPVDVDPEVRRAAEQHLIDQAAVFDPRRLRILGRRVLDVVAPQVAEAAEAEALDREDRAARRRTFLRWRRNGDGTTDLHLRVSDLVADRLLTYLHAFTNPRKTQPGAPEPTEPSPSPRDRRPYGQRLGEAFAALLETWDPRRLPLHGGDATTVIVNIDLESLNAQLDAAGIARIGDEPITAAQARRLACTASILPAVLGSDSQILDLGRSRRLFSPAQRKAMAIRDHTCRAHGCDIPATWCEAHHAGTPWARGGQTDLADGVLLCAFHHHRAHDHHYETRREPDGATAFHRRT